MFAITGVLKYRPEIIRHRGGADRCSFQLATPAGRYMTVRASLPSDEVGELRGGVRVIVAGHWISRDRGSQFFHAQHLARIARWRCRPVDGGR